MNIKKMVLMFWVLLIIYIVIQLSFKNLNHGHEVSYELKTLKNKFKIEEKFVQNYSSEIDNYYFKITINKTVFDFQTFYNFKKNNYVITDIYYYQDDNYKCIYPIFKNGEVVTDVICKYENEIIGYNNLKGKISNLDLFVQGLSKYGYDNNRFDLGLDDNVVEGAITFYRGNLLKNTYIGLSNYKGLYMMSSDEIKNLKLHDTDVYKNYISAFVDNYYISADIDYNNDYEFHNFNIVNIKTGNKTSLTSEKAISLDLYIQGIYKNEVYIFDRTNLEQYKINPKSNSINNIGGKNTDVKIYNNTSSSKINVYEAKDNVVSISEYSVDKSLNNIDYYKVDKIGNKLSGYYYMYEKIDNGFKVYRSDVQNIKIRKYLFTTTNINEIHYNKEYIYYINEDVLYYYSDLTNSKPLIKYSELKFNSNIKFGVYTE